MDLIEQIESAIHVVMDPVSHFIWTYILIYLLLGAGLLFTCFTRFMQFRLLGHMMKITFSRREKGEAGISAFQAFATSLASRVGTGNLAGVAIALWVGGPGAIFWMWITALLGLATAFIESTLAQIYKEPHQDGSFRGGPAYYIERGLGHRWMSVVFAIFLLIAYGLAFNGAQANTIAQSMEQAFHIPTWLTGVVLVVLTALIICGGIRSVARTAEKIVPAMATLYLLVALYILLVNIAQVPAMFALIFKSAFGYSAAIGGSVGYTIKIAMENGIKRGLFSNEAGMGSAPNVAATATVKHPAAQGLVQSFGVFVDTLVICSCTAVVILLSGAYEKLLSGGIHQHVEGIQLTQMAMHDHLGAFGTYFVAVAIFLFAFTSIIGNYAYGEINIGYLFKGHPKLAINTLRIALLLMVMLGSVADLKFVWNFADFAMGLMATTNLIAIILLAPVAFSALKDYERQRKSGVKQPEFDPRVLEKVAGHYKKDIW
ncbi:alanine/glycine:cation symporter family protein [Celerinatantimonas yamalensis]|uniref:Alanine/glycine:cation symporter family protein n=1 Tax=Celerinatantimonas yamalensis TaxID=559956 RepID=A0ABW9G7E9_9GAMM